MTDVRPISEKDFPATNSKIPPGFSYTGRVPSKRNPLKPLPDCFTREPDPKCSYRPLRSPIHIPSRNINNLTEGFLPMFPDAPSLLAHDVLPADLSRLLEDCHLIGKLTLGQHIGAELVPELMGVEAVAGFFMAEGISGQAAKRRVKNVGDLLDTWNEQFFAPRKLRAWVHTGGMIKDTGDIGNGAYGGDTTGGESDNGSKDLKKKIKERVKKDKDRKAEKKKETIYLVIETLKV
ncbi:uncharacterized protein STEHIDRAFT_160514 [Stereum hirsutum FP-91666 SS1]|uniref:uncharacterized protein n=1 Tax=Stereum hirsutum (strain FP-91666) TaxID=721885 RepID=UPI000444A75B|nr:uncharacterized protein STEHIDRAFT_160514 [Stereum hirsutum FP-91666 SS1]EIM82897.1 hypothetical protein STEHIDRAFT_160514 [Stereum hirsutum FP-91666 SS1]